MFILPSKETAEITKDVEYCGGKYDPSRCAYVVHGISADQITRLCASHSLVWHMED